MRYLNRTYEEACAMTFREYSFEIHAYRLRNLDERYRMHLQAWTSHQVTLTKQENKKTVPVYKAFKDFFNYEKELMEIEGKKRDETVARLANLAERFNE